MFHVRHTLRSHETCRCQCRILQSRFHLQGHHCLQMLLLRYPQEIRWLLLYGLHKSAESHRSHQVLRSDSPRFQSFHLQQTGSSRNPHHRQPYRCWRDLRLRPLKDEGSLLCILLLLLLRSRSHMLSLPAHLPLFR